MSEFGQYLQELRDVRGSDTVTPSEVPLTLYMKGVAGYWFPIMPTEVPRISSVTGLFEESEPNLKSFQLGIHEHYPLVVAVLAGKIGYLAWMALSDNFNALPRESVLPRNLLVSIEPDEDLLRAAQAVVAASHDVVYTDTRNGISTLNFKWTAARRQTDEFDHLLLMKAGLGGYWRALNIWYRQSMRSTGESTTSRYLTRDEIARIPLEW